MAAFPEINDLNFSTPGSSVDDPADGFPAVRLPAAYW